MKVKLFSQLLCHQNNLLLLTKDLNHQQFGNDSNLLIVFYVQIMPDDFVMQLHRLALLNKSDFG